MTAVDELDYGPIYGPTPPSMRELRQGVIRENNPPEREAWDRRSDLQRIEPTPEQVAEAREWVGECVWKEEPEDLAELTDQQVVRGVGEHYDGGWSGLVHDANLEPEPTPSRAEQEVE